MMAINYPTSLDTFTDPTATSLLTSPSHSGLHTDINSAVEALETKVAVGNTVLGVYQSYTPTWANLTVGDGSVLARYCQVNNFVNAVGYMIFGSTSAITGSVTFTLPINAASPVSAVTGWDLGSITFRDFSSGANYFGNAQSVISATTVGIRVFNTAGTYAEQSNLSATVPFTWEVNDRIFWNITYEAA
jgi:hypothetical protein